MSGILRVQHLLIRIDRFWFFNLHLDLSHRNRILTVEFSLSTRKYGVAALFGILLLFEGVLRDTVPSWQRRNLIQKLFLLLLQLVVLSFLLTQQFAILDSLQYDVL